MSMSLSEAKLRVDLARPGKTPKFAVDYDDYWIFWMVPIDNPNAQMVDAFTAINKTTKKITGFQPMALPDPDAYFKAANEHRIDFEE